MVSGRVVATTTDSFESRTGIANVPQVALRFFVNHFQIGERGLAIGAPIHHVSAAVDEAALVEAHEGLDNGAGEIRIEREAQAGPIDGVADALHLFEDAAAVAVAPLPDAFFKLLAAEVVTREALFGEAALDHDLGRDSGVIGARQP